MTIPTIKKKITICLSKTEIAWLAGLFEGEAHFGLDSRSTQRYKKSTAIPASYIRLSMTDEDVVSRVAQLLNKNVFSETRLTATNKKVFNCHIGDRLTLLYLLPRLLPYMGQRRTEKIKSSLLYLYEWKKWVKKRKMLSVLPKKNIS